MTKIFLIIIGCLSVGMGVLGIFIPLLPTTPLLLLAAACFVKSSPKLYDWLIQHKYMGPYIRNFREHRAIPLKAKIVSVSMVWSTLLFAAFFIANHWGLRFFLLTLAAAISWHILSYKTLKK